MCIFCYVTKIEKAFTADQESSQQHCRLFLTVWTQPEWQNCALSLIQLLWLSFCFKIVQYLKSNLCYTFGAFDIKSVNSQTQIVFILNSFHSCIKFCSFVNIISTSFASKNKNGKSVRVFTRQAMISRWKKSGNTLQLLPQVKKLKF